MSYPLPTEKLGDLAAEIRQLAEWADARLPGTAIETVSTNDVQTNGTGDLAITFTTITAVEAIIQNNIPTSSSGVPAWQFLQAPIWTVMTGAPANQIWAHAVDNMGQPYKNARVNVCAYGWGNAI